MIPSSRNVAAAATVEQYRLIAEMEDASRRDALRDLIRAEFEGESQHRDLTADRLAAWTEIARSDIDAARTLGTAYDAVFSTLPATLAMHRAMAVQAVIADFTDEDRSLLLEVVPGMSRHVTLKRGEVVSRRSAANASGGSRSLWSRLRPRR